jgi:hypothetical protein
VILSEVCIHEFEVLEVVVFVIMFKNLKVINKSYHLFEVGYSYVIPFCFQLLIALCEVRVVSLSNAQIPIFERTMLQMQVCSLVILVVALVIIFCNLQCKKKK